MGGLCICCWQNSLEALASEARAIERENGLVENAIRQVSQVLYILCTRSLSFEVEWLVESQDLRG